MVGLNKKQLIGVFAKLISKNPLAVKNLLRDHGVEVGDDKYKIAKYLLDNIKNNPVLVRDLSSLIVKEGLIKSIDYSSGDGRWAEAGVTVAKDTATGAQSGGGVGAIVGFIVGSISAGFGIGDAKKQDELEDEKAKNELYADLFSEEKELKKNNLIPILIVGGVLLVSAIMIVVFVKF